ncbi:MAG: hypothetical protein MZV64_21655 [Ignavibacteriales bacterium]|nr:hypothetical protein [Ignavibacteriales bacterium]
MIRRVERGRAAHVRRGHGGAAVAGVAGDDLALGLTGTVDQRCWSLVSQLPG